MQIIVFRCVHLKLAILKYMLKSLMKLALHYFSFVMIIIALVKIPSTLVPFCYTSHLQWPITRKVLKPHNLQQVTAIICGLTPPPQELTSTVQEALLKELKSSLNTVYDLLLFLGTIRSLGIRITTDKRGRKTTTFKLHFNTTSKNFKNLKTLLPKN